MEIEEIKPEIGAVVRLGHKDMSDPAMGGKLFELLDRHSVIVFPQANFTDEQQLALTDALGSRVNIASRVPGRSDSAEVYQVTLDKGARIEPEYVLGTYFWHMDGLTVDVAPPRATVLSARKIAPQGGQTEFASTKAGYEALPDNERAELAGLRVLHTVTASLREFVPADEVDAARRSMSHEHPLVLERPDGSRTLVLGSTADRVVGMGQAEGRALLARLLEWCAQPAFSYRHEWNVGDCVIWDNTAALHRVIPYSADSGRMMHRTAVGGA